MLRKILIAFICLILICSCAFAEDEITLTSDKMQYDLDAGRFAAEGNVTITGQGLILKAERGEGLIEKKTYNLSGNISVTGIWRGDDVDLTANSASASMGSPLVYTLESGIRGHVGKVSLDCEYLQMVGDNLTAKRVRKLMDTKNNMTFVGDSAKAKMANGTFVQVEADGNVTFTGVPGKSGEVAVIHGKRAVYSVERGTVVVTGGVSAVQKRRTIHADTIIYFPKTNRIEAVGNPRITINVEDEQLNRPAKPAPKSNKK